MGDRSWAPISVEDNWEALIRLARQGFLYRPLATGGCLFDVGQITSFNGAYVLTKEQWVKLMKDAFETWDGSIPWP